MNALRCVEVKLLQALHQVSAHAQLSFEPRLEAPEFGTRLQLSPVLRRQQEAQRDNSLAPCPAAAALWNSPDPTLDEPGRRLAAGPPKRVPSAAVEADHSQVLTAFDRKDGDSAASPVGPCSGGAVKAAAAPHADAEARAVRNDRRGAAEKRGRETGEGVDGGDVQRMSGSSSKAAYDVEQDLMQPAHACEDGALEDRAFGKRVKRGD